MIDKASYSKIEILRQKIKEMVEEKPKEASSQSHEMEVMKLTQEIAVQQIELEMQIEELKQASEQAIIAAREYADLYDFAPSGYFTLTPLGEIKKINFSGANMLGKERTSLINSKFGFFVSDDTRPVFNSFLTEIFISEVKKTCEVELLVNMNISIYVNLTGIADPGGVQCYLNVIDITERKLSEQELRESETKFKNLVWDMPVGVLLQGPQSEIHLSNPKALELLGLNEDQLLGKTSLDPDWNVIHEDGSPFPGNTHPAPRVLATGLPVRNIIMGVYNPVNDERVWLLVDAIPQLNDDGNIKQVVCTLIDISKRKKAEEELLDAEWKFRALFENGPIGVAYHEMIYDTAWKPFDYRFIDANSRYIELTGIDPRGKTVLEAFPGIENDPFDWIGTYAQVVGTGKSINFEQYLQTNDRWYNCVAFPYNKPDQFVVAFFEITERKRAEEDLLKKMDELLRFQRLTVDREIKMIELKKEVNELLNSSGKEEKYRIAE